MQITHEEAHRLIQFRSDNRLEPQKESDLREHLIYCVTCRQYSEEIRNAETILQQTMRKQWDVHPLPLQMSAVLAKVSSNANTSIFVPTRTAFIGLSFVLFAFITWQLVSTTGTITQQTPLGTLPLIPTPSSQQTATNTLEKECREVMYVVQKGDTLEGVARQFSISKEAIQIANNLADETLSPSRKLVIPLCESTPTSTMHPPTFTITPIFDAIGTTPG